ncbi:MAG: DUF4430 domain-containing protein [Atopobiaceae bacterium]
MAGYIVHDPDSRKPEQEHAGKRRPSWKLPLAAGIVLVVAAVLGLVAAFGLPQGSSTVEEGTSTVQEQPALTEARIEAALKDLAWKGADIGLDPASVTVTIQDDGSVSVAARDDGKAADAVPLAAKRLLALASWIQDEMGADAPAITWSVSTTEGVQVFEGSLDAGKAPAADAGSTEELLSALSSYQLSDAAWQDLGLADVPESGGRDSQQAGESAASSDSGTSQSGNAGEDGSAGSGSSASAASGGSSSSGSGGAAQDSSGTSQGGSAAPASQPGSGNGSDAGTPSSITVSVSVDSSLGGGSSTSATVSLPSGSSVLDALQAAGYSVDTQNTQYGIYIVGIGGVEASSRDRKGWVYAVNGVEPSYSAANYALSSGDSIAWTYVSY